MRAVVLRPGYKDALSPYVKAFAWLKAHPGGRIRTWWGCPGLDEAAFRRLFRSKLEERITLCDPRAPKGRKTDPEYQLALRRDADIINAHAQRAARRTDPTVVVNTGAFQFGRRPACPEIRARFRDLLMRAYDPDLDHGPLV